MKSFALLDSDNKVINISLADDSWSADGWIEYEESNPAFIGGDYVNGYFYPPQPFPSWLRDGAGSWNAPKPMPQGLYEGDYDNFYRWDESQLDWVWVDPQP